MIPLLLVLGLGTAPEPLPRADGYAGSWYSNGTTKDEYKFKYSGGTATYPTQQMPNAIYSKEANKTFFVFGGKNPDGNSILHMVSYYDHATGMLPRPAILLDKKTTDAHDNPVLSIDPQGHLWIFSNAHGTGRPSYIHRSVKPYEIDRFELIRETNFSYGSPWCLSDGSFLFLHTLYQNGHRVLHTSKSRDGRTWSEPAVMAHMVRGSYQVTWRNGNTIATSFDYHPEQGGLDARTNMYYLASTDGGTMWKTASGATVKLPLTEVNNAALMRDFEKEKKLCYIKDLNFDAEGRPAILIITSSGAAPGPKQGPHEMHVMRWIGRQWQKNKVADCDHNYDHGSLYVEADGTWRVIAPTGPGPQPFGTGGELAMYTSEDHGATWKLVKQLTANSKLNQHYPRRPVDAQPDFYCLWCDGDARKKSESHLFFTNRDGSGIWRLPAKMEKDYEKPVLLK